MSLPGLLLERAATAPGAVAMRRKRLGRWEELRWGACAQRAAAIGAGFTAAGVRHGDRVALLARSSPEWVLADLAAQGAGAVVVPVAPTADDVALGRVVLASGAVAVVAGDEEQVDKVLALRPRPRGLRHVFVVDVRGVELGADGVRPLEPLGDARDEDGARTWRDAAGALDPTGPAWSQVALADPDTAPAERTHADLVAAGDAAVAAGLRAGDEVLSHLPLWLPAEHAVSVAGWLRTGCTVNLSGGDEGLAQELREVQPTFLLGVPALWDGVHRDVERRVTDTTRLKRAAFRAAAGGRLPRPVAHALVCRSVRDKLGLRRARRALTVAGRPSDDTTRFFRSIGVHLVEARLA